MTSFVDKFGILRVLLVLLALLTIVAGVVAANVGDHFDWDEMPVALVPAFTPIVFTVILFDMMMSKIRRSDTEDSVEKSRFRDIVRVYKFLVVVMILSWIPFIASIIKGQ